MSPPSIRYSREELLALRDRPGCRGLPPGLDSDDLSDLQESCFFDKAPTLDGGIYLGPQRGPGGPRAPFGAAARRPAGPGPIHSRLIEEEERGAYQRTSSGQLPSAFGSSPTKPQAIGPRGAPPGVPPSPVAGRYEDPAKMDRWDSRKLDRGASGAEDNWQQAKGRGDNWRGGGLRGSMDAGRAGGGGGGTWGGRAEGGQPELARSGSSAPKDNGRWVRDDDDWRARKQSGAMPEPRYDWSDNRAPAAPGAAPGAATRGPPPGFGHERQPEWAEDGGGRPRMTAADIEAERLRMQEQWKKQGNAAKHAADSSMADIMTDDDIMNMMAEESEKQSRDGPRAPAANGKPAAAAPHAGQHVDVAALLGGRPQPGSPAGGIGSPASLAGSDRTESMRSRFANFFKLEEAPAAAASAAPAPASGGPVAEPAPAAPPPQQQLTLQEQLSRAASASRASPPAGMPPPQQPPTLPAPQQPEAGPGQQSRDAGQALLAMLKQQQAAQRAAAAGGAPAPPMMPPNAVNAADVSVLEEADKVARLTALQGLDDDLLGSPSKAPPAQQPPAGALPPGMPHLPPGALPPPGHLAHPQQQQMGAGPPHAHALPQGFPGQLPPGMLPPHLQHPGHLPPPPHGAHFPPPGMPHMPPPGQPGGLQPPPGQLGAGQFRPGQPGLQYRPPGVGLPPQPGMQHPGMPPPQLQQQQQQNALLAQLLAAQARGPPPPAPPPQVQPGQQINLAALLGAAGNPGMQLPMGQQGLNPAQLQALRPPAGMMPPGMPAPGVQPGINPALLQQIHLQQLQMQQQQRPPPMGLPPGANPQQLSSAQLMAALGLAQQGGMPQGLR